MVAIGYLANNMLPVRLGELVRAHFLGEREGISKASSLASIGVERVFDGLTLLLFIAVIWPFLPWTDALRTNGGGLRRFVGGPQRSNQRIVRRWFPGSGDVGDIAWFWAKVSEPNSVGVSPNPSP